MPQNILEALGPLTKRSPIPQSLLGIRISMALIPKTPERSPIPKSLLGLVEAGGPTATSVDWVSKDRRISELPGGLN